MPYFVRSINEERNHEVTKVNLPCMSMRNLITKLYLLSGSVLSLHTRPLFTMQSYVQNIGLFRIINLIIEFRWQIEDSVVNVNAVHTKTKPVPKGCHLWCQKEFSQKLAILESVYYSPRQHRGSKNDIIIDMPLFYLHYWSILGPNSRFYILF